MTEDFFIRTLTAIATSTDATTTPPDALLQHPAWNELFLVGEFLPDCDGNVTFLAYRARCLGRLCRRRPTLFACFLYQTIEKIGEWLVGSLTPTNGELDGFTWPRPVRVARQALLLLWQLMSAANDVSLQQQTATDSVDQFLTNDADIDEDWFGGSVTVKENPTDLARMRDAAKAGTQSNGIPFVLSSFLEKGDSFFPRDEVDISEGFVFGPYSFHEALQERLEHLARPLFFLANSLQNTNSTVATTGPSHSLGDTLRMCLLALPFVSGFTLPVNRIVYPNPTLLGQYRVRVEQDREALRAWQQEEAELRSSVPLEDVETENPSEGHAANDPNHSRRVSRPPPVWLLREGFLCAQRTSPEARKLFEQQIRHRVTANSPQDGYLNMHWDLVIGVWETLVISGGVASHLTHLIASEGSCGHYNTVLFGLFVDSVTTIAHQGTTTFPRSMVRHAVRFLRLLSTASPDMEMYLQQRCCCRWAPRLQVRIAAGLLTVVAENQLADPIITTALGMVGHWVRKGLRAVWMGVSGRAYSSSLPQPTKEGSGSWSVAASLEALDLFLRLFPNHFRHNGEIANGAQHVQEQQPLPVSLLQEVTMCIVQELFTVYVACEQRRVQFTQRATQTEPFQGDSDTREEEDTDESSLAVLLRLLDGLLQHSASSTTLNTPLLSPTRQTFAVYVRALEQRLAAASSVKADVSTRTDFEANVRSKIPFFAALLQDETTSTADISLLVLIYLSGCLATYPTRSSSLQGLGQKQREVLDHCLFVLCRLASTQMTSVTWTVARQFMWALEQHVPPLPRSSSTSIAKESTSAVELTSIESAEMPSTTCLSRTQQVQQVALLRAMCGLLTAAYHGVPQLVFVVGASSERLGRAIDHLEECIAMSHQSLELADQSAEATLPRSPMADGGCSNLEEVEGRAFGIPPPTDKDGQKCPPLTSAQQSVTPAPEVRDSDRTTDGDSIRTKLLLQQARQLVKHCALQRKVVLDANEDDVLVAIRRTVAPATTIEPVK